MDRVHPATAPSLEEHDADAGTVTDFGYKPVLRRSMGRFTTFAISFSLISISTGIFANYSFGLDNAGPRLLWSWVIVGVGQMVIALNLAHMAPRIPLAGYAYQWASRMRSAAFGWFPGWFALAGWLTGTAGVAYAFAAYFAPYAGLGSGQGIIILVTAIVILAYLGIHLVGIRATAYVNNFSVVTELIGITAVGIGLLIYSLVRGLPNANASFNFSHGSTAGSAGLGAFAVSALLGAYTLTGYEGAADLAEESKDPRHSIPRAIIMAEAISAGVGFLCLVAACFVLARQFSALGQRRWAVYSRVSGLLFLAGFAASASGSDSAGVVVSFWAAVLIAWAWIALIAAKALSSDLRSAAGKGPAPKPPAHELAG